MPVIHTSSATTHQLGTTKFSPLATPSLGTAETAVWQVDIEPHTPAMIHQVSREEIFVVLAGRATVTLDGSASDATAGDAVVAPPHTDFGIGNDGDTTLRLLCCQPVGGQAITEAGAFTPPWAQ